jgi:hypothetical protein
MRLDSAAGAIYLKMKCGVDFQSLAKGPGADFYPRTGLRIWLSCKLTENRFLQMNPLSCILNLHLNLVSSKKRSRRRIYPKRSMTLRIAPALSEVKGIETRIIALPLLGTGGTLRVGIPMFVIASLLPACIKVIY